MKKLPPELRQLAERFRTVRRDERFSVAELAQESGIGRSAIVHWECGRSTPPFPAGDAVCRRLDLNQYWLATGRGVRRPWVDLADLPTYGANLEEVKGLTFYDAVTGPLASAFEKWSRAHPESSLIEAALQQGIKPVLRRMSTAELEATAARFLSMLRRAQHDVKAGHLEQLKAAVAEMERRIGGKNVIAESNTTRYLSPVQIKERIKTARETIGLTQPEAAKLWEVPLSTLRSWEQGQRVPRGLGLKQLETILRNAAKPKG